LIDQPEMLEPLRDQVLLLEFASQEIGDDALSARLASEAGIPGLGVYGDRLLSAPRLEAAIARASLLIGALLQSSTSLRLDVDGPWARWTYDISASTEVGRQKHDILALGYMLDLLRRFAGPRWTPPRASSIRRRLQRCLLGFGDCLQVQPSQVAINRLAQSGQFNYLSTITGNNAVRSDRYCEVSEVR
jgi:hypothetical protein